MDNDTIRGNNFIMTEPGLNDLDQDTSKTKDSGTNSTAPDSAVSDPLISDSVEKSPEIKTNTDKQTQNTGSQDPTDANMSGTEALADTNAPADTDAPADTNAPADTDALSDTENLSETENLSDSEASKKASSSKKRSASEKRRKEVSKKSASLIKGKRKTSAAKNSKPDAPRGIRFRITNFFAQIRQGISQYFTTVYASLRTSAKWIFFGILCGAVVGTIASIFAIAIKAGTQIRAAFPPLLYALPVAGIIIVYAYRRLGFAKDGGTNTILEAIREGEQVPIRMAPLIFLGTVLTHMFGGSAGREGAALQIGGSIGNGLGRMLHFKNTDTKRVIMCGMSAAFSALFGTPLAAAILPIEISTVGIMYYSSLVPCVLSSLVAFYISQAFGLRGEAYPLGDVMPLTLPSALLTVLLSVLCAFAAILFCAMMDKVGKAFRFLKNDYIRAAAGGVIVVLMTLAVGSQTYNGAGANIIEMCFENRPSEIFALAFLLKMIFTAVTLGSGYKGGEIVPSLFIGATLGVKFGALIGFSPSLCAALGMCALFCGVTNCPVASLLICFEMFGFDAMPFFLLAVSFTYLFSGNFGLYHGQVIRYSKYEPGKVNAHTHH